MRTGWSFSAGSAPLPLSLRAHPSCQTRLRRQNQFGVIFSRVRELAIRLKVIPLLEGIRNAIEAPPFKENSGLDCYILVFDAAKRATEILRFDGDKFTEAINEYASIEKDIANEPDVKAVLIMSPQSLVQLRTAYPSYYTDTGEFVSFIEECCELADKKVGMDGIL